MKPPVISIVIPVYNDPNGITTTLNCLFNQKLAEEAYEIIVVDNNSTDNTPNQVRRLLNQTERPANRLLFETDRQSSYAARNRGIRSAQGDWIVFLDADVTIEPDWLSRVFDYATSSDVDYFSGRIIVTMEQKTLCGLFDKKILGFPVRESIEENDFAPTACLIVHRDVFESVGLFDKRLLSGGDKEFGRRVSEHGFQMGFVSDLVCYHPARTTLSALVKKWFRTGRGQCQLVRFHEAFVPSCQRSIWSPRYFAPPAPSSFRRLLNKKQVTGTISPFTKAGFYFLSWVRKIVRHLGYLTECQLKTER